MDDAASLNQSLVNGTRRACRMTASSALFSRESGRAALLGIVVSERYKGHSKPTMGLYKVPVTLRGRLGGVLDHTLWSALS